jgi:hypothetical protein
MKSTLHPLSTEFGESTKKTLAAKAFGGKGLVFNKSALIVNLFVLIVFLQNPPWPLWDFWFPPLFLCFLVLLILLNERIIHTKTANKNIFYFTLLLFIFFIGFQSIGNFRTSSVVTVIIFFQLYFLSIKEKCEILKKVTSILALIIAISLPLWLINQFVVGLPVMFDMQYGDWKGDSVSTIIENYLFFVQEKGNFINRFYSIFDEPGVLGTLSAFLLFANKYNFKDKRIILILLGGIFTYSLAFFILTLIGLLLYYVRKPLLLVILCFGFVVIGISIIIFFDQNPVVAVILERLLSPQSSLESRVSSDLEDYFLNYISSVDFVLGKGTDFFENNQLGGQGYQVFLIENGFFGSLLVIGMYLFIFKGNRYLVISYLLLFLLSSLQRPFLFTPYQIIVFYIGVANLSFPLNFKQHK